MAWSLLGMAGASFPLPAALGTSVQWVTQEEAAGGSEQVAGAFGLRRLGQFPLTLPVGAVACCDQAHPPQAVVPGSLAGERGLHSQVPSCPTPPVCWFCVRPSANRLFPQKGLVFLLRAHRQSPLTPSGGVPAWVLVPGIARDCGHVFSESLCHS